MRGRSTGDAEHMQTPPAGTPWLRWARRASLLAAIAWAGLGVVWVYRSAMRGDVLGAAAGAGLCLAVIILDCVAASVLRLGRIVLRAARRVEELDTRLNNLEATIDAQLEMADLATAGRGDPSALVAASLDEDTFPRLLAGEDPEPSIARPSQPLPAERELELLVRDEMNRLRDEFVGAVRGRNYAAALRTGERIASLFPESRLAEEFELIREHLQKRAAGYTPGDRASVV